MRNCEKIGMKIKNPAIPTINRITQKTINTIPNVKSFFFVFIAKFPLLFN